MSSKRFIKQIVPLKVWRKLKPSLREAWYYMWMTCDEAGVFYIDEDLYEFNNKSEFPLEDLKTILNEWLLFTEERILIKSFIQVNYGEKLNPDYNPHKPLFRAISKNKLKLDSSLNQAYFKLVDEDEDIEEDVEVKEDVKEIEVKDEIILKSEKPKIDFQKIVDIFNSVCKNLPEVQKVTKQRQSAINARVNEYGLSKIGDVFQIVANNEFLNGNNDKGWNADFDWIMNPNNFIKILEGKYNGKQKSNSKSRVSYSEDFKRRIASKIQS